MSTGLSQIISASYPAVLAEARKPQGQWQESAFLRALEKMNAVKHISMGPTIEAPLDYKRNPNSGFLATDLTSTSLSKTEVITAASYTPGILSVPIVWSKADEAKNPSENQKIALVKSLLTNAFDTHDDLIEEALFGTTTEGFLGLQNIVPDSGQGTVGGINAATDAWFRNHTATFAADGSNIQAALTTAWNTTSKGTGSKLGVKLIVSGAASQAIYESKLQANIRYMDVGEGDAGFKALAFKDAMWVFSKNGGTNIYGLNPKSYRLVVSKEAFRQKGETQEIQNAHGYVVKLFSMLQAITDNKSRLFVLRNAG
jgi:hypothetical protein